MADQTVIPFFRSTYEDVLQDIRTFEVQNHLYFNHSTRQAGFNKDTLRTIANAEKAITIRWKDPQPNSQPFLRDDGYPFYICGRKRLVCHHGPDTKLGSKAAEKEKMDKEGESDHNFQRRRHINQPCKKVDCPAAISIRHIIRFHDFQVPADAQSRRKNAAKRLKSQIDNGEDVHHEHRFYVHFPSHKDHQNHLMGPAAGLCQPMASALKERVRELVHQGVQQPHQVLEHLQIMVMNEIFKGQVPPPRTNAQYWPSYITVYNLIYSLSKDLKNRKTDIPNLENTLDEWQVKLPGLKYHLQTGGVETNKLHYKDTPFLMVMQTAEQRHLLKRYGNYVVCLDATYKTTMYDLPLYFMAVPTNAIYMVVAAFIPKLNTSEGISQAINILKDWNPGWLPAKVMTDYCSSEIDAVRKAFPETSHRLCEFHRKQAWSRWMREKNRVPEENRVPLLTLLERIAVAPLPKSVDAAIQDLKESPCWTAPVSEYLERYWLNKTKMWCEAYDTDFHRRVNTNNGLERQNELLKATYFRNFRGKQTLNMLLHILLNDFYPERWRQYLKANIAATHLTKPYNTDLVSYLHNRPKFFVDHVKKNHEKSMVFAANDIYTLEPGTFHVNSEVESGLKYRVCFGPDAPSCECRDWQRHNMPCKHMCAIFRCIGSWPFNKLAAAYTSSPFLTLDDGVINEPLAYHGVPAALPAKKTTTLTNRTTVTSQTRSPSKALQILQSADITGGSNRGKKCRDLLKQLNNLTYLTKDQTILINLADELEVLVGRFYNKIPSLNGITLLPATQKRKRRPKVVKPKKRCSTTVAGEGLRPSPKHGAVTEGVFAGRRKMWGERAIRCTYRKSHRLPAFLTKPKQHIELPLRNRYEKGLGICLACEIKNFLEDAKIGPDGVLKCVWQGFPHGAQQCVHEVLMYIAREINRITQTSDQHGAFHEVFGNSGFSQMTCGGCKEPGQTIPEVWTIWTVPMAFSVNAAVEKLFQREHIPVYHCDSCKQDTSAFKETVLHKPPNKLVLHLNRFMSNGQKNIGSMPVEENVVVPIRGGVTPYKISGIVCHLGNSVAAGHYIAYVKREGLWVFFDDEKEGKVVNWMSVASQEAYLIFYDQDTSADTVLVEDTPMPEPMLKPQVTRSVPKEVRDEVHRLLKLTAIKEQTKYVGTCPGSSGIDAINAAIVKYFSQEELTREQHTGRGKVVVCLPYVQLMVKEVDIYIQRLVTGNIPQSESMMHSDFLMGRFEVMKKGFGMGYVSIVTETYLHMLVMRWFKRVPTNENEPVTSGHYMQFNRWEGTDVVQAALNKYRKDNISEIHTVYLKVVTKEVMVFLVRQLLQVTYQETWTACQRAQGNAVRDVMNTALIIERERLSAAGLCDV